MSTNNAIINHIGLKNFKGYQEADIPLAPITLFFGPNSAGKSTVFQMLYLLKQTLQYAPDQMHLLFRCDEKGYVDLGSFEDVIFDHDVTREISIEVNKQTFRFRQENRKLMLTGINVEADTGQKDTRGVPEKELVSAKFNEELPNKIGRASCRERV